MSLNPSIPGDRSMSQLRSQDMKGDCWIHALALSPTSCEILGSMLNLSASLLLHL